MAGRVAGIGRIKGSVVREFIGWYEAEFGREALVEAIESLSDADQEHFDLSRPALGVLPSTWYPATVLHHALDALLKGRTNEELDRIVEEGAKATVGGVMKGLYKLVFDWLMNPERFGKVVKTTFRLSYDSGRVENEVLSPTKHRGTTRGWKAHHPFLCRMNVAAKRELYERVGCKNPRIVERFCISDGADVCGSVIEWDE